MLVVDTDLQIDTFEGTSGVLVRHTPTGMTATSSSSRSQQKNIDICKASLEDRLQIEGWKPRE